MAAKRAYDFPKYICYLSNSKVENIYSQIATIDVNMIHTQKEIELDGQTQIETPAIMQIIKNGLSFGMRRRTFVNEEGQLNHIQKFRSIISFCQKNGLIRKIDQVDEYAVSETPLLFSFSGKFTCTAFHNCDTAFLAAEKVEADSFRQSDSSLKTTGRIVVLKTNIGKQDLYLACSTKYFSNMGCERISNKSNSSNEDFYAIRPHSGNHFFFSGDIEATFDAIFILNGQTNDSLYGSPIALINDYDPNLQI